MLYCTIRFGFQPGVTTDIPSVKFHWQFETGLPTCDTDIEQPGSEIIFICWAFNFVYFVGRTTQEFKIFNWFNLLVFMFKCVFNFKMHEFKCPRTCPL